MYKMGLKLQNQHFPLNSPDKMNPTAIIKEHARVSARKRSLYTIWYRLHSTDDWKPKKHKMFTLFTSKKQLLIKSATKCIPSCKSIDLPPWIGFLIRIFLSKSRPSKNTAKFIGVNRPYFVLILFLKRVQILNGSSRYLTPSHTTRDVFMNWSFAFSRDVSLGHLR